MMNARAFSLIVVSMFLASSGLASAQDAATGLSISREVQAAVNQLVDFTRTSCVPAGGAAGSVTFICISDEPVFSVPASKKAWVLVVVASLGKILNDRPSVMADELYLSDANLMKSRVAYMLRAGLAKSLQRQIYSDQITLDGMYATIESNLVKKTITK